MSDDALTHSRALWNRRRLDLASDEMLAQLLDRGEPAAWRALYRLAREDAQLRARIKRLVTVAPIALPRFWLAALASLGETVDYDSAIPNYVESGGA
jgi:hypothetical protein